MTRRPRKPRGHLEVDNATFDRLVWPDCEAELPDGAGWATFRTESRRYCTFMFAPGVQ